MTLAKDKDKITGVQEGTQDNRYWLLQQRHQ